MNISRRSFLAWRFGRRPKLFISYRRRPDSPSARLLKEALVRAFGEGTVFRDVDDIRGGSDFAESIRKAVESCDAFIPLITHGWLQSAENLQKPDDFVRQEIAAAFARQVPVIPVLVDGARMPAADELPAPLRPLASRQAVELSDIRWDYDVQRLVHSIRVLVERREPVTFGERAKAAFRFLFGTWLRRLAAAALLAASVYAYYQRRDAALPDSLLATLTREPDR